jgi:hypothetical protein
MAYVCNSISCFLIIVFLAINAPSQKKSRELKVTNCEEVRAILDVALVDAIKLPDHYIFFILRPGKKEKTDNHIKQRITDLKNHIEYRLPKMRNYIIATGAPDDIGSVEIYVDSKFYSRIIYGNNLRMVSCL